MPIHFKPGPEEPSQERAAERAEGHARQCETPPAPVEEHPESDTPDDGPELTVDGIVRAAPADVRAQLLAHFREMDEEFKRYPEVLAFVPSLARLRDLTGERIESLTKLEDEDRERAAAQTQEGGRRG